jgi:hypothetical protein
MNGNQQYLWLCCALGLAVCATQTVVQRPGRVTPNSEGSGAIHCFGGLAVTKMFEPAPPRLVK